MNQRCIALAVVALLAGACQTGDGAEEKQKLALHREFARKYFDNNQLVLAEQQVDMGLAIDDDDLNLRLMKAWIRQRRGAPQDVLLAEQLFRELVREDDYRAMLGLAESLERKGVLYWESAAPVERGERETAAADPKKRADEMRAEARASWTESVEWYEKTLEKRSGEIPAVNGLQRVWALLGDVEKSLHWSETLLSQSQREIDYWRTELQRPDLRAIEEEEYRRLLGASTKLLVETRLTASTSLVKLGRKAEALPHLDQAIALEPERAESFSRRAQIHRELGALKEARDDIQQFLRLSTLPVDHPDRRRAFDLMAECEVALKGSRPSGG